MAKLRANRLHEHAFGRLWDTLSDPEYGQSDSVDKCAFSYGIKDEMPGGTLFTWLREHVRENSSITMVPMLTCFSSLNTARYECQKVQ